MSGGEKFRLITRRDFDGLASAVLLKHLDLIRDIQFAGPRDVQDGRVEITAGDITTNLPYVDSVHLAFDHHLSESRRHEAAGANLVNDPDAPSAAQVVFGHYGGADAFPPAFEDMMEAVNKSDSGQFVEQDVLRPEGWVLLSFLIDTRTGLEGASDFSVTGDELLRNLVDYCMKHGIEEMFALPDVRERVIRYFECEKPFKEQLSRCATEHGKLVLVDLRAEETVMPGIRFIVYALHPNANISTHVLPGESGTLVAVGKSIFDRSSQLDVAELMARYGGGGHRAAGTCQVDDTRVDAVLREIIEAVNAD